MLVFPMWEYGAHPELKAIRDTLKERFGNQLVQLSSTPEWFTFQVVGLTDAVLIRQLELAELEVFGVKRFNFQTMCSQTGAEPGVSIRYLPFRGLNSEPGFWFY